MRPNILAAGSDVTGVRNIGRRRAVAKSELAEWVLRVMNKDVGVSHQPARAGDIRHSLADIGKARLFGYEPKYDLEQGLRTTISSLE
jgi:UDP-glucose 4-epimerase